MATQKHGNTGKTQKNANQVSMNTENTCLFMGKAKKDQLSGHPSRSFFSYVLVYLSKYRNSNDSFSKGNIFNLSQTFTSLKGGKNCVRVGAEEGFVGSGHS